MKKKLHRVLKPESVFVHFDADRTESIKSNEVKHRDNLIHGLPSLNNDRPEWDMEILADAGFEKITGETDIYLISDTYPNAQQPGVFKVLCAKT